MTGDEMRYPCSDCGSTTGRCEHELCPRCRMVGPDHMPGDDDCRRTDAWVRALIADAEKRAAAQALRAAAEQMADPKAALWLTARADVLDPL